MMRAADVASRLGLRRHPRAASARVPTPHAWFVWEHGHRDGVTLRDERGKVRYGTPLIEFTSTHARSRFIEQVLEALRQVHTQVFAAERAPA
jgi:hypothetical protein